MAASQTTDQAPRSLPKSRIHLWKTHPKHKGIKYTAVTIPFRDARDLFEPIHYNDKTGQGEQRKLDMPWVRKLQGEMDAERYSPADWSACLTPEIEKALVIDRNNVTITLQPGEKLPLIDAQQRKGAMDRILEQAVGSGDEEWIDTVLNCDITVTIYLVGDPQKRKDHFQNLQKGRQVSRTLLQTMEARAGGNPILKAAHAICRVLNTNKDSHLFQLVGTGNDSGILGFSVLATKGGSELATSVYGGVKIAQKGKKNNKWLEATYVAAYKALVERGGTVKEDDGLGGVIEQPKLFQEKFPLTPKGQWEGSKGGSSLIIGVGNILAYWLVKNDRDTPNDEDYSRLIDAAVEVFGSPIEGGVSAPYKRNSMGDFVRALFRDSAEEDDAAFDDGIPRELTEILSRSTFGLKKVSKKKLAAEQFAEGETEEDQQALTLPALEVVEDEPVVEANGKARKGKAKVSKKNKKALEAVQS